MMRLRRRALEAAGEHVPRDLAVMIVEYAMPAPTDHYLPELDGYFFVRRGRPFIATLTNPAFCRDEYAGAYTSSNMLEMVDLSAGCMNHFRFACTTRIDFEERFVKLDTLGACSVCGSGPSLGGFLRLGLTRHERTKTRFLPPCVAQPLCGPTFYLCRDCYADPRAISWICVGREPPEEIKKVMELDILNIAAFHDEYPMPHYTNYHGYAGRNRRSGPQSCVCGLLKGTFG